MSLPSRAEPHIAIPRRTLPYRVILTSHRPAQPNLTRSSSPRIAQSNPTPLRHTMSHLDLATYSSNFASGTHDPVSLNDTSPDRTWPCPNLPSRAKPNRPHLVQLYLAEPNPNPPRFTSNPHLTVSSLPRRIKAHLTRPCLTPPYQPRRTPNRALPDLPCLASRTTRWDGSSLAFSSSHSEQLHCRAITWHRRTMPALGLGIALSSSQVVPYKLRVLSRPRLASQHLTSPGL